MFRLRDGTGVLDRGLAALVDPDLRSLRYAMEHTTAQGWPHLRSRVWELGEAFDQGPTGACVAAAWAHVLSAEPTRIEGLTWKFVVEQFYWPAQRRDRWPGGEYPGAKPVLGGTSVVAVAQAVRDLGLIGTFRWATTVVDLALALAATGPVVVGLEWYEGMRDPGQRMATTGRLLGRHCVSAIGIEAKLTSQGALDLDESLILIQNSRGGHWGDAGRSWITLADVSSVWISAEVCAPIPPTSRGGTPRVEATL